MERRQLRGNLDSDITVSVGVLSGAALTSSTVGAGSSHYNPGTTYSTAMPASSWPSNELSTTTSPRLSGSQSPFSDVGATFFSSKGAMAGVFAGLGILVSSLCAIIYLGWIHKRRRQRKTPRPRDMNSIVVSDTFPEFKIDLSPSPAYPFSGSDPLTVSSRISPSVSTRYISLSSLAGWWERRRGGQRSSQFRSSIPHSESSSVVGEEDTQWTLGKVLEDQRHQIILPLPPVQRMSTHKPQLPHAPLPEMPALRDRNGDEEGEGGRFTLEDALLPSLSSSPIQYELGCNWAGRHPYAQP